MWVLYSRSREREIRPSLEGSEDLNGAHKIAIKSLYAMIGVEKNRSLGSWIESIRNLYGRVEQLNGHPAIDLTAPYPRSN